MIHPGASCFGCGACSAFCPRGVFEHRLDRDGFLMPVAVAPERCVECGLCEQLCPLDAETESAAEGKAYSGWSKDPAVRQKCSSGGIAFELSRAFLADGGKVCGAVYSAKNRRVEHRIAETVAELESFCGSKYLQSYTVDAFRTLKTPGKYLVIGTPCQIAAIRRLAEKLQREDDFLLVDFFCHGVPSRLLWDKYLAEREARDGAAASGMHWRNKRTGWHDSWNMTAEYSGEPGRLRTTESRKSEGDLFYRMFLGNFCLNPACYDRCRFKAAASAADLRLGDLWGPEYAEDELGMSGVLAFSEKGARMLESLASCELKPESLDTVLAGQMRRPAERPWGYRAVGRELRGSRPLAALCRKAMLIHAFFTLPARISGKIRRMTGGRS